MVRCSEFYRAFEMKFYSLKLIRCVCVGGIQKRVKLSVESLVPYSKFSATSPISLSLFNISHQGMGILLQAPKEAKSFVFYTPSLEFHSLVSYWLELETNLEPSLGKALREWRRSFE